MHTYLPRLLSHSSRMVSILSPSIASGRIRRSLRARDVTLSRGFLHAGTPTAGLQEYRDNSVQRVLGTRVLVPNKNVSDQMVNLAVRLNSRRVGRSFCAHTTAGESVVVKEKSSDSEEKKPFIMQSVRIRCRGDIADGLVEALMCFGASSCSIEDAHYGSTNEQEIYTDGPVPWQTGERQLWEESHITAIFPEEQDVGESIAMASHSIGFNEMPHYVVELMEDQDWIEQLQSMFEPVEVAAGLWIVPNWRAPPNPMAVNVILDPGLAFGTGEHPTTRLCLQLLHQVLRGGERMLDYGTGSGILSIAALKMGASRAVGIDIDPMAITSARYNASLNDLDDQRLQVFLASINGEDPVPPGAAYHPVFDNDMDEGPDNKMSPDFDIVIANILLNPLVDLASRIANYARPGAFVGLSGILVEQVEQVRHTYACYLDNIQVTQDCGWACVSGVRKLS
ncbi:ribosomal protein L11 methyltransferase [Marchantia polymorpha subsp. ruderalis]|uniref:ETFB lysine methyltransferase n=2 Tax=Marchantia polymorpha TaxID=3197 RepID=A0AAF6BDV6_MARPO|nr:hypothetical protein MARPO_0161s0032 [Marchantia polymorpha]BBN10190.1 hypothetical protein Mp_5g01720 [Marchantia polymorpha subsp. ruderalis]|eukprot:PTQ28537.1 hypothetical protein MARPO_0161s0032 [Marchantia polymorpha]